MNTIFKLTFAWLLLLVLAFSLQPSAFAQVTPGNYFYVFPLTNSAAVQTNSISITNSTLTLSSNCTYIIQSQPFPIWRGRGFTFNGSFVETNAENAVLTFNFRTATLHSTNWNVGTGLVTNWSTTPNLAIAITGNGTTAVFFSTNVPPTWVDNVQYGQLYSIGVSTAATASRLDPTNLFISVFPPVSNSP